MSRPSQILIAGWAHTASALDGLTKRLAPNFDIMTISADDLWSDRPNGRSSVYAASLVSMLESYEKPPIVAGWSMGGMIALEAATRRPALLSALVLIGAGARFCAGPDSPGGATETSVCAMARHLKKNRELTLRRFFERAAAPEGDNPSAIGERIEAASLIDDARLLHGLEYLRTFDAGHDLEHIPVPAFALHGRKDCIVPWQSAEFLRSRMPSCRCFFDEKSGHDLPIRKPGFTAAAILDFWNSLKT